MSTPIRKRLDVRSRILAWHAKKDTKFRLQPAENTQSELLTNSLTRPEDLMQREIEDTSPDDEAVDELEVDSEDSPYYASAEVKEFAEFWHRTLETSEQSLFTRGDLIDVTKPGRRESSLAIFLGITGGIQDVGLYLCYTVDGDFMVIRDPRSFHFKVNRFVNHDALEALRPYWPQISEKDKEVEQCIEASAKVPTQISGPLLKKLNEFRNAIEKSYRELSPKLATAHMQIAHPSSLLYMTIEDIAQKLFADGESDFDVQSMHVLVAINRHLMLQAFGFSKFVPMRYATNRILLVLPERVVSSVKRAQVYARAYQEKCVLLAKGDKIPESVASSASHFEDFIQKSKRLILISRKFIKSTPQGSPLSCSVVYEADQSEIRDELESISFTSSDRDFIQIIALGSSSRILGRYPELDVIPSMILRATGLFADTVGDVISQRDFLTHIGVLDPWSDISGFDLGHWDYPRELKDEIDRVQSKITAGSSMKEAAGLCDSMESFRKDWDSLPVFCIDGERTTEMDDGISLEAVDGSPGHVWLHVHIAHPSSHFSPDHMLGRTAQHHFQTMYLSTGRITMLPAWVNDEFSLGLGKPVLTISTLLDGASNILGTKIQPGRIHNVIRLTPERIDEEVFGIRSSTGEETYTLYHLELGQRPDSSLPSSSQRRNEPLSDDVKKILRALFKISNDLSKGDALDSLQKFKQLACDTIARDVDGSPLVSVCDLAPSSAHFTFNDPWVEVRSYKRTKRSHNPPSRNIVERAMLLAGKVAGLWADARNIPLIYSGTASLADNMEEHGAQLQKRVQGDAHALAEVRIMFLDLLATRLYRARPIAHGILGHSHVVKVTSPIRKYLDLVSLWQIDAALREEHRTGNSLVGTHDTSYLPFQLIEMQNKANICESFEKRTVAWLRQANRAWLLYAMARAFYLNEAPLPDPLHCVVGETPEHGSKRKGWISTLQTRCIFVDECGEDGNMIMDGDVWETKVVDVEVSRLRAHVMPLRRVRSAGEEDRNVKTFHMNL